MSERTRHRTSAFFLNLLRIVVGLLFMQHGVQKLFAGFGADQAAEFLTQRWFAGILEFYGGGLIALGLFTRTVSIVLATEMMIAWFQAHAPRGWIPVMNGGELAVFFCFTYLYLAANGGGSFSVDGFLARRRAILALEHPPDRLPEGEKARPTGTDPGQERGSEEQGLTGVARFGPDEVRAGGQEKHAASGDQQEAGGPLPSEQENPRE